MHISISLQHSKKEREREAREAEENSGKERKRIDELEAAQVRRGGRKKGAHITKGFWDREKRGVLR